MFQDRAHGSFKFHVVENAMIIQAYGAWNLECAEQYIEAADAFYNKSGKDHVDLIIDISQLEGITPEAALKLNAFNKICRNRQMFKSEAFYTPASKVMLHITVSILKLSRARQVGISDYDNLIDYISPLVSPQGLKSIIPLFIVTE